MSKVALQNLQQDEALRYFFSAKEKRVGCTGNEGDLGEAPETGIFAALIALVQQDGMELDGILYRSGEIAGDVSRYIFTPGAAVPLCENAQLTSPAGMTES